MKVLVLGGTRFFGIHLVDELLKSNFHKFSQGTYVEFYNIELFDIPFSKKYLTENSYNNEYFDINNGYKICYQEYIWEKYFV